MINAALRAIRDDVPSFAREATTCRIAREHGAVLSGLLRSVPRMSTHSLPAQALLREVTGPDRTCQISSSPAPDGRWEFSLITCDTDGQILSDLSGVLAPDDVGLILSALPLEIAALGAWGGPPSALAERRLKHPNLYAKWTEAEESDLVERFRGGARFTEIAGELGRTVGGVKARLIRLGELSPEDVGWRSRGRAASEVVQLPEQVTDEAAPSPEQVADEAAAVP